MLRIANRELGVYVGSEGQRRHFLVQVVNPNVAMTAPPRVRALEKLKKSAWVEIEIHERRNREVRRMFEALGYVVEKLIGVQIGNVELGGSRRAKFAR